MLPWFREFNARAALHSLFSNAVALYQSFVWKRKTKHRFWTTYELFMLSLPLLLTAAWATHPYVQHDLNQVLVPSAIKPEQSEPVSSTVTMRPDGSKLVEVTVRLDLQVDPSVGGWVRKRVEPPKEKIPEPRFTRATDGSNRQGAKRKDLWRFLSAKSVVAILKLISVLKIGLLG